MFSTKNIWNIHYLIAIIDEGANKEIIRHNKHISKREIDGYGSAQTHSYFHKFDILSHGKFSEIQLD